MGIAIPSYNDEKSAALSVPDTVVELSLCCCKTGCIYSKKMYRLKKLPCVQRCFYAQIALNEKSDKEKIGLNSDLYENND